MKISAIITENGRAGETHFALSQDKTNDFLRQQAIDAVRQDEIAEWYRLQYNIPLHTFEKMNIDYTIMYSDFYRRQYYYEYNLGIRNRSDKTLEFQMPSFTAFRPFGGPMPVPNGFGVNTSYTTQIDSYKKPSEENSNQTNVAPTTTYTADGKMITSETSEIEMDDAEYQELLSKIQDGDDTIWEDLESLIPQGI